MSNPISCRRAGNNAAARSGPVAFWDGKTSGRGSCAVFDIPKSPPFPRPEQGAAEPMIGIHPDYPDSPVFPYLVLVTFSVPATPSSCKANLGTRPAGFLLSAFFRRPPSGTLTVRAKITTFSRLRRNKLPRGGGSKGIFPSKLSTPARPVPQNPSGHPHALSPTMLAPQNIPEYGNTRRQTPRTSGK